MICGATGSRRQIQEAHGLAGGRRSGVGAGYALLLLDADNRWSAGKVPLSSSRRFTLSPTGGLAGGHKPAPPIA